MSSIFWFLLLLVVACLHPGWDHIATAQAGRAFLQDQLPLKILLTTPADVIKSPAKSKTTLDGRQAITAVFSRPVIALGADFGVNATVLAATFPFSVSSCSVPGKPRWVTTSIARFDPDVDWPTDLDCQLDWNTNLTTYDGAPLVLGSAPPSRRLTSKSLTMAVAGVVSDLATNLTDGLWDGTLGLASDVLPEVPPDGRLQLSFNYPVTFNMLRRELQLTEGLGGRPASNSGGRALDVNVTACQNPGPWVSPAATASNGTCAEVRPLGGLKPNTSYTLRLNRGSRYNSMAGPLGTNLSLSFGGLRPFRVPWGPAAGSWGDQPSSPLSYRRLDLWLPHGLANDTNPSQLAASIAVCRLRNTSSSSSSPSSASNVSANAASICQQQQHGAGGRGGASGAGWEAVPFSLSLVSRGKARLSVPSLQPGGTYRGVAVARTDGGVRDGFGQPLMASTSADFNMSYVPYNLAAPTTTTDSFPTELFLLEAGAENLTSWPYALHPPPPPTSQSYNSYDTVYDSVAAWTPDLRNDTVLAVVLQILTTSWTKTNLRAVLGSPAVEVSLNASSGANSTPGGGGGAGDWREVLLPLLPQAAGGGGGGAQPPARRVFVAGSCCVPPGRGDPAGPLYGKLQVLLNSSLSVSAVQAGATLAVWVLDAALGGGPVAGAAARVFVRDNYDSPPRLLTNCTTDRNGLCNVTLVSAQAASNGAHLVVSAGDQLALLPEAGWVQSSVGPSPKPQLVGSLVADRLVVVPGDSVKITGFVQRVASDLSLALPPESIAVLQVTPPWVLTSTADATVSGSGSGSGSAGADVDTEDLSLTYVMVNGTTGTLHGEVAVPQGVRLQSYTIQLLVQPTSASAGSGSTGRRRQLSAAGNGNGNGNCNDPWVNGVMQRITAPSHSSPQQAASPTVRTAAASATATSAVTNGKSTDVAGADPLAAAAQRLAVKEPSSIAGDSSDGLYGGTSGAPAPAPSTATESSAPGVVIQAAVDFPVATDATGAAVGEEEGGLGDQDGSRASSRRRRDLLDAAAANPSPPPPYNSRTSPPPASSVVTPIYRFPSIPDSWWDMLSAPPPEYDGVTIDLDPSPPPPPLPSPPLPPPPEPAAVDLAGAPPLDLLDYSQWPVLASLSVTVADPRPPTADLQVAAPPWAYPNATVTFNVTAVSYIGASVAGASMTATWSTSKASGVVSLLTDSAGLAAGAIDLGALPPANVSDPYDTLSIDVEWIGPTRERITRSASVTLADGPARLQLQLSLTPSTPGTAFALAATLTSNTDGAPLTGLPVTATLRPAPPDADHPSSPTCINSSSCVISSGAPFSPFCQLTLPCMGRFLLEACAELPASSSVTAAAAAAAGSTSSAAGARAPTRAGAGGSTVRACTSQTLGYDESDWAAQPWSAHDEPDLTTDKSSYTYGDSPVLLFQSPWPYAKLLVVWGNEAAVVSKVVTSLPAGGLAQVPIGPLGRECRGGCSVTAVLDVPRLKPNDLTFLGGSGGGASLPTSRLFDPLAPHTHTMSAGLNVRPDNALTVSVNVSAAAGGGGAQQLGAVVDVSGQALVTLEPGANATVKVAVSRGSGANATSAGAGVEVTVYGVDKAFLDLLPYDLPHPELQMVLQLSTNINGVTVDDLRVAPGAVRAVYDKLMARLTQLDPWLPADTFVGKPSSNQGRAQNLPAVDQNDTAYLAAYSSAATVIPGGSGSFPSFLSDMFMPAASAAPAKIASAIAQAPMPSPAPALPSPPPPPPSGGAGGGTTSGTVLSQPRETASFQVTPLFTTAMTGPDGVASVRFTAPANLGTFVIRAFAASGASGGRYGAGEGKLAVRRRLSLTPSLPRFVRVGDNFSAGVLVTVGSAPASVAVSLQLAAPSPSAGAGAPLALALTGAASQMVTFASGGGLQQEVRFSFSAGAIGSANLTFTAQDTQPGGGADALQSDLQVMGQQGDVWVATSFALSASPPNATTGTNTTGNTSGVGQWQEGMDLPAAVPGSGGLNLTAGVGYLPAISAFYDTLMQTDADRDFPQATPAMLWATLPAVLSNYGRPVSAAQGAAAAGGFCDLSALTSQQWGLLWQPPERWGDWQPSSTDVDLNTWALFLAAEHGPALRNRTTSSSTSSSSNSSLAALAASWAALETNQLPVWRAAVAQQLVVDAVEARQQPYNPGPYSDWDTLAWARLALGAWWDPRNDSGLYSSGTVSRQISTDLSVGSLVTAVNAQQRNGTASLRTLVLTSLVLQLLGSANPSPKLLAATLDALTSALRVQGRTAYVAAGSGTDASASPLEDQAMALLLLLRSNTTIAATPLIPKLAAYVANPAPPGGYGVFTVPYLLRAQGLAVAALTEYDRVRGSARPDVNVTATANGVTVMKASFRPTGSTEPVTTITPWSKLQQPANNGTVSGGALLASNATSPGQLNFQVIGSGEVTVAASLHFVPAQLLSFPTYRGLFVESALQMADPATGGPTGQRLATVPLGSVVVLSVQLTSPDDLGPVTLSVMMPAGLEPVDPNLEQQQAGGTPLPTCAAGLLTDVPWNDIWLLPQCPAQETRPYLVTFSYLGLRAGTSSVTLRAVAATPGTFVFPPIRASADDQPELMGMTAAGTITVCADCARPGFVRKGATAPKACPKKGCGPAGVCNLSTGKCVCSDLSTAANGSQCVT